MQSDPIPSNDVAALNAATLAALFENHSEQLRRMVTFRLDSRLASRVAPSDVLQEAYVGAVSKLAARALGNAMPALVWLRLEVAQTVINVHRRHLGRGHSPKIEHVIDAGAWSDNTATAIASALVDSDTSPSEAALRAEHAAVLKEVLLQMSPLDREVIALRHFEGLTNQEASEILAIHPKAASERHRRALLALREVLKRLPAFRPDQYDRMNSDAEE